MKNHSLHRGKTDVKHQVPHSGTILFVLLNITQLYSSRSRYPERAQCWLGESFLSLLINQGHCSLQSYRSSCLLTHTVRSVWNHWMSLVHLPVLQLTHTHSHFSWHTHTATSFVLLDSATEDLWQFWYISVCSLFSIAWKDTLTLHAYR